MLQKGRLIKATIAVYGGEQGQYIGRTIVTLDKARKVSGDDADVFVLGPDIRDKPAILQMVKSFEDALNEKLRKAQKEEAAERSLAATEDTPDHFVGVTVCERCHKAETDQWHTTAHARAWQTLVDDKKDADTDCTPCHVVGYRQPGGFVSGVAVEADDQRAVRELPRHGHQARGLPGQDHADHRSHLPAVPQPDHQPRVLLRRLPAPHPAPGPGGPAATAAQAGHGEGAGGEHEVAARWPAADRRSGA